MSLPSPWCPADTLECMESTSEGNYHRWLSVCVEWSKHTHRCISYEANWRLVVDGFHYLCKQGLIISRPDGTGRSMIVLQRWTNESELLSVCAILNIHQKVALLTRLESVCWTVPDGLHFSSMSTFVHFPTGFSVSRDLSSETDRIPKVTDCHMQVIQVLGL